METETKLQVKKEWKTPELIVLVRSKPEEAVLIVCKGWVEPQAWETKWNGCGRINGSCHGCEAGSAS